MNSNKTSHEDGWKRLTEEPNDIERLSLWVEERKKHSGDRGALDALRQAADLPASWLAKIWLTRPLLEEGKLDESMRLYAEALRLAPRKSGRRAAYHTSHEIFKLLRLREVAD